MRSFLVTLVSVALYGGMTTPAAAQDYYGDIRPVLVRHCSTCHTSGGIGWSMDDPEQTYARRQVIANAIVTRQMPPWLAEPGHQKYVDDPSLAPEELQLVERWRAGGFLKGEPKDLQPAGAGAATHLHGGFKSDVSVPVLPGDTYLPNQTRSDDYRCFVVDWPADRPTYITGFRAVPGNRLVAHHLVVYAITPEMVKRFRELDEAEEGPGYQCFGGAVPDRLGRAADRSAYEARYPNGTAELNVGSFWLAHWAPGMDGHEFPKGTGIRIPQGSGLVVQMHYYGGTAPGQRDAGTRMEFEVADSVERPALHFSQTQTAWLNGERNRSMVVPPGGTATYQVGNTLGELLPRIARITGVDLSRIRALEVHSVNLHMHAIGQSGEIRLRDRTNRTDTLLSVPRWDLRWQRDFTLEQPRIFSRDELAGTVLSVQCTYRNPKDRPVYGGYGSDEEMCFNFSYIAVETK